MVDDEPQILTGFRHALHYESYDVLTAGSAADALAILAEVQVDVIVADEQMPGMTGSELLAQVQRQYPHITKIMLTGHASLEAAVRAINEGAVYRFLQKPCDVPVLKSAIDEAFQMARLAAANARVMEVVREQADLLRPAAEAPVACAERPRLRNLTGAEREVVSPREQEVLELLVQGHRVSKIAEALFVSPHTVRNHLKSLYRKLDVHSQAQLIERFVRGGRAA